MDDQGLIFRIHLHFYLMCNKSMSKIIKSMREDLKSMRKIFQVNARSF